MEQESFIEEDNNAINKAIDYFNNAQAKLKSNNFKGAKKDFILALIYYAKSDSKDFDWSAFFNRIIKHARFSKNPTAYTKIIKKAIEESPDCYHLHLGLAKLYFLIGNYTESFIELEKVIFLYIKNSPKSATIISDKLFFLKFKTYFDIAKEDLSVSEREHFENSIRELETKLIQGKSSKTN